MRFWWINQNQTYRHEIQGGYLWSPKKKQDGSRNPFYEFMREVAPGDVVFSFSDGLIKAVGVIASHGYEAPKPMDFGNVGAYWEQVGWRVDVRFHELSAPVRPKAHMHLLAPLLPPKYAPLRPDGNGLQSVYLTLLPPNFANALSNIIGGEVETLTKGALEIGASDGSIGLGLVQWEEHQISQVSSDGSLSETTRQAVVQARRGQGLFKQNVMKVERSCRLTGVDQIEHLIASHCKPWRDSSNTERLDGNNGLLLTPNADHLFDRGFISFQDDGTVLISKVAHVPSIKRLGLNPDSPLNVGEFNSYQSAYLSFHRESVFLEARLSS